MIVLFGGTGTLGHALSKIISEKMECIVVSRCELRQKAMKAKYPQFDFVLGDVTSPESWKRKLPGHVDYVFNLSAMKHVELGESNVQHCLNVNYNGAIHTADYAYDTGANYIFSSTDKAVLPINAYGMSKGLAERMLLDHNCISSVFRWGNVLGSRGSVLHVIKEHVEKGLPVPVTSKDMSRFWIHIDDVANFMWERKHVPTIGEPHIPPMKAARLIDLVKCIAGDDYPIKITGIRPGEKIHEVLRTGHDWCLNSKDCDQYSPKELSDLVERSL